MPLFEYTCENCDQRSELLIMGNEKPVCPHCGGHKLHKEFSTFATSGESGPSSAPGGGHSHGDGCGCCMGGPGNCGLN